MNMGKLEMFLTFHIHSGNIISVKHIINVIVMHYSVLSSRYASRQLQPMAQKGVESLQCRPAYCFFS